MRWRARGAALALTGSLLMSGCTGAPQPAAPAAPTGAQQPGTEGAPGSGPATARPTGAGSGEETSTQTQAAPVTDDGAEGQTDAGGPVEVTIAAIGDVLAHSRLNLTANAYAGHVEGAYDYTPMFADVAPLISAADLALCHMETPLSPDDTDLSVPDTLSFNTPHEMADALAGAGVDGCDFASNHTMDRGLPGIAATEQVLRGAGLGYTGPTTDEDRAGVAEVYEVPTEGGAVRVAHLAYTYTYPNSGSPTTYVPAPPLEAALWPLIGSAGILRQAAAAREAGADFVVVSMHWGNEYQAQPTDQQRQIAADLLGSDDVDLVLGTHVHVIQPCERINGKHVAYGLGNFLSNQSPDTNVNLTPPTQEGMVATFTLRRDAEGVVTTTMQYQPTRVEITPGGAQPGPHVVRLVSPQTYPQTWERTTSTVDLLGGCDATPVHP